MKNIFKELNREDFIEAFAVLIYLTSIGFAWAVTFIEIPEENQRNADTVLGFLMGSALTAVLNHLFRNGKDGQTQEPPKK